MSARRLAFWAAGAVLFLLVLFAWSPDANADPGVPAPPVPPFGSGPGIGQAPGIGQPGLGGGGPGLSPAAATIFLCPGLGGAASVIGGGGGYCDWNFTPVQLGPNTYGIMHDHCEWGGFNPIVEIWNCWRVWPGRSDHPALPDPDVIPDGMMVPWAISGPAPSDQWPPPGLQPVPPPGPPPSPEPGPAPAQAPSAPMFPPWDQMGPPPGPPPAP